MAAASESGITTEALKAIGGSEWTKGEMRRIYFNDLGKWLGLECHYYNSGNISSARLNGEGISNSQARRIVGRLYEAKLWYDLSDNEFHGKGIEQTDFDALVSAIRSAAERAIEAARIETATGEECSAPHTSNGLVDLYHVREINGRRYTVCAHRVGNGYCGELIDVTDLPKPVICCGKAANHQDIALGID